jgi:hypothetical protein
MASVAVAKRLSRVVDVCRSIIANSARDSVTRTNASALEVFCTLANCSAPSGGHNARSLANFINNARLLDANVCDSRVFPAQAPRRFVSRTSPAAAGAVLETSLQSYLLSSDYNLSPYG